MNFLPKKSGKQSWKRSRAKAGHQIAPDIEGDIAADMKSKVTDFTDPATLKNVTDGELFYIIKNGKGEMPPEGSRVNKEGIWNLVNYVRSLAKFVPSQKKEPSPQAKPTQ